MSESIYIDMEQSFFKNKMSASSIGIIGEEVIYTGKTIHPMPSLYKKEKAYQILADEFDVKFIFDDDIPEFHFYPIPCLEILAIDSRGGCIGSSNNLVSLDEDYAPIYYISNENKPFYIASNLKEFLRLIVFCTDWKKYIDSTYSRTHNISKEAKDYLIDTLKLKEYLHDWEPCYLKNQDLQIYNSIDEAKQYFRFYDLSNVKFDVNKEGTR